MKKTMIYLEDNQFHQVKELARRSGKSMSDIIRKAVSGLLGKKKKKPDYFSIVGIARGQKGDRTSEDVDGAIEEIFK